MLKAERLLVSYKPLDLSSFTICSYVFTSLHIQGWGGGRNAQRDAERRPLRAGSICAIGSSASG